MHPTDKAARIAGALYLLLAVTAPFSLIYVPRTLVVRWDATATADNVLGHEMLFRLGIVGDLISAVIFIFLAMLFLRLHRQGNFVNEIFWGLWLFPFGLLVTRSGFLPRILGVLLIVNGLAYVAASLTWLLLPAYGDVVSRVSMPALFGELWIMLWLLIRGTKVQPAAAPAS